MHASNPIVQENWYKYILASLKFKPSKRTERNWTMDILGRAFHLVNEHKGTDADENKDVEDGGDVSRRHHVSICTSRNEPPVGASSSEANRLIELNHVLGKGFFGTVYACTYKGAATRTA